MLFHWRSMGCARKMVRDDEEEFFQQVKILSLQRDIKPTGHGSPTAVL